jgi:hypothetical protein
MNIFYLQWITWRMCLLSSYYLSIPLEHHFHINNKLILRNSDLTSQKILHLPYKYLSINVVVTYRWCSWSNSLPSLGFKPSRRRGRGALRQHHPDVVSGSDWLLCEANPDQRCHLLWFAVFCFVSFVCFACVKCEFMQDNQLQVAFKEMYKLAELIMTIPSFTVTVERSFSTMKRIHTCRRGTQSRKGYVA